MNEARLAELERLCNEATPGPWRYGIGPYGWDDGIIAGEGRPSFSAGVVITNSGHGGTDISEADCAFIIAARTALPEIVAALREAWGCPRRI